jgi:hypothetical protein
MTYLLKSEVEKDELQTEINVLKETVQQLSSSSSSSSSSTFHITSSQKSFLLPDLSSQKALNLTPPPPPSKASTFHTIENDAVVDRRMKELEKETEVIISNLDLKFEKVQDYQNASFPSSSSSSTFMSSYPINATSSSSTSTSFFHENEMFSHSRPSSSSSSFENSPYPSSSITDGFTGTSPTDLLFSPAVLSKTTPKSSSVSSSLRPTSSSTTTFMIEASKHLSTSSVPSTAKIAPISDLITPIASFRPTNGLSSNSFHLMKTESLKEGNYDDDEEEEDDGVDDYYSRHHHHHHSDLSFERDEIEQLKDRILLSSSATSTVTPVSNGVRDSTESTIERLSYQFTNSLTTTGTTTATIPSVTSTPSLSAKINFTSNVNNQKKSTKINRKEEQSTIVIPNESIPIPTQPSKHPFSSSLKYSSTTPTGSSTNKENFNYSLLTTEKKVYDARYGSF